MGTARIGGLMQDGFIYKDDGDVGEITGPSGEVIARVWNGNPVQDEIVVRGQVPTVCWSGWLDEARPGDGWFERSAAAWLPSSGAAREAVIGKAIEVGGILRPHARHLVSDVPACLNLMRQRPEARLMIEPAAFFEPSMIETSDEHLVRIIGSLAGSAWGVLMSDVAVRGEGEEAWCVPVPLGEGVLDAEAFEALVREYTGAETRIVRRR